MAVSSPPWSGVAMRVGVCFSHGHVPGLACPALVRLLSSLSPRFLRDPQGRGRHILEDALTWSCQKELRGLRGVGFVRISPVHQTTGFVSFILLATVPCVAQNPTGQSS